MRRQRVRLAEVGFWQGVLERELFPLPVLFLLFPTLTVLFSAVGFLLGFRISGWCGGLGLLGTLALGLVGGGSLGKGWRRIGWFVLVVALIFALDEFFFFFSWWDTQAYHLPASKLMLEGWNPVMDATREGMLAATGADPEAFNAYHVAYLPRAGWMWNAVTAALTGNLESGDTLILLAAAALCGLSWRVSTLLFGVGRWKRFFFASLTLLSPGVAASAFCGAHDGAQYALFLMLLLAACAYRKTGRTGWLSYVFLTPVLGCNLKFTGMICMVLGAAVFTVPMVLGAWRERKRAKCRKWFVALVAGFGLAGIVGFSPYLTNWANHGGPLYPEHTFSKTEQLPAMTADFDLQNDDAAAMGYMGRLVNAYFSKWLAHRYYEWKLGRKPFSPVFHLDQVGGLGTGFRVVMCLTLLTLCFTRRWGTPWLLVAILLTTFLQPTKTMGYVRYVPQFWMFPLLVAFNAMTVNGARSPLIGRTLGMTVTGIMAIGSYLFVLGKVILSLGLSIYSLSVVEVMRSEETPPKAYIFSRHARYREDGRCLAAWETLPPDIPSPRLFDFYYRSMLTECGVQPAWQSAAQRDELDSRGVPNFYLGENMLYWPQHPERIRMANMHYFSGPNRKASSLENAGVIFKEMLPELPHYTGRIIRLRWEQWKNRAREGQRYGA